MLLDSTDAERGTSTPAEGVAHESSHPTTPTRKPRRTLATSPTPKLPRRPLAASSSPKPHCTMDGPIQTSSGIVDDIDPDAEEMKNDRYSDHIDPTDNDSTTTTTPHHTYYDHDHNDNEHHYNHDNDHNHDHDNGHNHHHDHSRDHAPNDHNHNHDHHHDHNHNDHNHDPNHIHDHNHNDQPPTQPTTATTTTTTTSHNHDPHKHTCNYNVPHHDRNHDHSQHHNEHDYNHDHNNDDPPTTTASSDTYGIVDFNPATAAPIPPGMSPSRYAEFHRLHQQLQTDECCQALMRHQPEYFPSLLDEWFDVEDGDIAPILADRVLDLSPRGLELLTAQAPPEMRGILSQIAPFLGAGVQID